MRTVQFIRLEHLKRTFGWDIYWGSELASRLCEMKKERGMRTRSVSHHVEEEDKEVQQEEGVDQTVALGHEGMDLRVRIPLEERQAADARLDSCSCVNIFLDILF